MQRFAQLYTELDTSTATRDKVAALCRYWREAPPEDAAWAAYLLSGGKPRRALSTSALQHWGAQAAGIDPWLFEASYQAVGDLAETIAHLLPPGQGDSGMGLSDWLHQRLLPLRGQAQETQFSALSLWMAPLDWAQRFVLIKLIGGGWRVGVSRQLVLRALSEHSGVPATVLAQRMMGYTDSRQPPDAARYLALIAPLPDEAGTERLRGTQPYPFCLAHPLECDPATHRDAPPLGPTDDWMVEWKFDGIRAQIVRRDGQCGIWSRGEELITERFPDIVGPAQAWPEGTVVDGELLAIVPTPHPDLALPFAPAPFARLQQRILRQRLSPKWLRDVPCAFVAYDLLEWQGEDQRALPQRERRRRLDEVVAPACGLVVSPLLNPVKSGISWSELASKRLHSRDIGTEGLMLKHHASQYGVGRSKAQGLWWKWKTAPMTVDAVLIYAQAGHGRRASLYTDYTFAVWSRPPADESEVQTVLDAISARQPAQAEALQLVAFAKAYSGLSDAEIQAVDKVIRATTLEKFGPVRSLRPSLVFELGFEGIAPSPRHKSGMAVRFPRILRWRTDKTLREADTLDQLRHWLSGYSPASA